jgi:hypothetical protein
MSGPGKGTHFQLHEPFGGKAVAKALEPMAVLRSACHAKYPRQHSFLQARAGPIMSLVIIGLSNWSLTSQSDFTGKSMMTTRLAAHSLRRH